MKKGVDIGGKAAIAVGLLLITVLVIRSATFADLHDAALEKAVRDVLWTNYSGIHLGPGIDEIRKKGDYPGTDTLLKNASPDAIRIERMSRSEPLMSWSSNRNVIVRVRYRFPDDPETQTEYMVFDHGALSDWIYQYDTSAFSYYLNFF